MFSLKQLWLGVALIALPLGYSSVASAATFDFTSCHASTGCGPAGTVYGTVSLTQDGTSVDFDVKLNTDGSYFVVTGAGDGQYFKFNNTATGASATNITSPTALGLLANGPLPTLVGNQAATSGGFSGDGTGPFNFGISCTPACGGGSSGPNFDEITFTVTNTTLANLETNNGVTIFAADIAIAGNGANTGPIDASTLAPVPLPGAFVLFGTVLAGGLGAAGWRKRRTALAA